MFSRQQVPADVFFVEAALPVVPESAAESAETQALRARMELLEQQLTKERLEWSARLAESQ